MKRSCRWERDVLILESRSGGHQPCPCLGGLGACGPRLRIDSAAPAPLLPQPSPHVIHPGPAVLLVFGQSKWPRRDLTPGIPTAFAEASAAASFFPHHGLVVSLYKPMKENKRVHYTFWLAENQSRRTSRQGPHEPAAVVGQERPPSEGWDAGRRGLWAGPTHRSQVKKAGPGPLPHAEPPVATPASPGRLPSWKERLSALWRAQCSRRSQKKRLWGERGSL